MIKMFEEYNLKNINDWKEITNDHQHEFDVKYQYDGFTDEEYSNIIKLFTDVRVEKGKHQISITSNSFYSLYNDDYFLMNITKYQDDWYIVCYCDNINNDEAKYYLCDQFYNMIKCIRHLVSSNISSNIKESNGYENISRNDHRIAVGIKNREYFTKSEVMYLINVFKDLGIDDYYFRELDMKDGVSVNTFDELEYYKGGDIDKLIVNITYKYIDYRIFIYKSLDEWFYLKWHLAGVIGNIPDSSYYRCDQVSGVKLFIENFLDITK